jgi:hypothetical protein
MAFLAIVEAELVRGNIERMARIEEGMAKAGLN